MALVLALDDDAIITQMLRRQLEADHHDVVTCLDALDALARMERRPLVEVIITDWHMPGFSGIDVLTVVEQKFPDVRRILVTAAPGEPEVEEAVRSGLVQYLLVKPWSRLELWRVMQGA